MSQNPGCVCHYDRHESGNAKSFFDDKQSVSLLAQDIFQTMRFKET